MRREYSVYEIHTHEYVMEYRKYNLKDGEAGVERELARYTPKEGYNVWHVRASYAKTLKPSNYYVIAKSLRDAKAKFKEALSYMNFISSVELLEGDAAEEVLTHPFTHYIF